MNTQTEQANAIAAAYEQGRAHANEQREAGARAEYRYGYEEGHHDARRRGRWLILIATVVAACAGHLLG